MRKKIPKPPELRDVNPIIKAINQYIPIDGPLKTEMRQSISHIPNYRIQADTHGVTWSVDVYKGGYYYIKIKDKSEVVKNIRSFISFLSGCLDLP